MTIDTRQLAEQGNPQAIAALLNRALQPKGFNAKAALNGTCLRIVVESAQVPSQAAITKFVRSGLEKLAAKNIETVKLYGRQVGEKLPAWEERFQLRQATVSELPNGDAKPETVNQKTTTIIHNSQNPNRFKQVLKIAGLTIGTIYLGLVGCSFLLSLTKIESPVATTSEDQSSTVVVADRSPLPASSGIGVSRQAIQTVFEKPEIAFNFETSTPVDGQPRVMGKSRNGLAFVELVGQPTNLMSAAIMVGLPNDDVEARQLSAVHMLGFLKTVAPEWTGGSDWLAESLRAIRSGSQVEAVTTYGNNEVRIIVVKEMGLVTLSIKPQQ